MTKHYRDNGAIGALLDEYERAIMALENVIVHITPQELCTVVDHETEDTNCKSIQTILTHVVSSGYNYAVVIRKFQGEALEYVKDKRCNSAEEYIFELHQMFKYNEQVFLEYPNLKLEEHDTTKKIIVKWGQQYDIDQLMEHAIVHILRHRRQIERFLIQLND